MEKGVEHNKENCVKWLAGIGASTSGSKQELTIRINLLSRYPGLVQKLKAKSEKAYVFPCSLDSVETPPATAKWRAASDELPRVDGKNVHFADLVQVSKRKRYKCSQVEKLSVHKF